MRKLCTAFAMLCLVACNTPNSLDQVNYPSGKPRVVVLTDGEVDDRCSMAHFLLYTNDMQVDAIIQTNSGFQRNGWSHDPWIEEQLTAYEQIYPNLRVHDADYPSADALRAVVYVGDEDPTHIPKDVSFKALLPGDQPMIDPASWTDTPGSDRLVELLLEDDPRPIFIQCWGGGNTAARAFYKLQTAYPTDYERAIRKAVLYCIWYQDGAGNYIERNHPQATILLSHYFSGTWDYGTMTNSDNFVAQYLRHKDNPLGFFYTQPFISEGDSPAFLHCIDNGLRATEHPTYGGWGGRFYRVAGFENVYRDLSPNDYRAWIEPALRDFQARLQWAVTPDYVSANHVPKITIADGLDRTVRSGELVELTVEVQDDDPRDIDGVWRIRGHMWEQKGRTIEWLKADPEGRIEAYRTTWSQLPGGSWQQAVDLRPEGKCAVRFRAPEVSQPETIHILLEAYDMALPRMTSYARFIITVEP